MSKGRRRKKLPTEPIEVAIESLSPEGRGVAHVDGKTMFVDGALSGETVMALYRRRTKNYDEASSVEVLKASPDRVTPVCEHFGVCGGCSLQHMDARKQIEFKQQVLVDQLLHIGGVSAQRMLEPLVGDTTGYRHKARLGVRFVAKKEKVLVGFRERGGSYITETNQCPVLHADAGQRISQLQELIEQLSVFNKIPQIEVAIGDNVSVLVLRHLEALTDTDMEKLAQFEKEHQLTLLLQAGGPDDLRPVSNTGKNELLEYRIDEFDIRMQFSATDFTQVNPAMNRRLVKQAIDNLKLSDDETVLDLFCGIGNFTLPISRHCSFVAGVEGSGELVRKAKANAALNGINNVSFHSADLSQPVQGLAWSGKKYDRVLIDPPRSGAMEAMEVVLNTGASRIVYVSCHPATLARDAAILVNNGYRLVCAGVVDMFPHTAHVESMAVFVK